MSISTDKIQFVPSQGTIQAPVTTTPTSTAGIPFSTQYDIVLPEVNSFTAYNESTRNQGLVYNSAKFGFTYLEQSILLSSGQRTFARVNIVVPKNSIPSISGIKVIGYATTTNRNTASQYVPSLLPGSNYGNPVTQNIPVRRTFMFKIWKEFRWGFTNSNPTDGFKPNLESTGGECEIYASTGEGNPIIFTSTQSELNDSSQGFKAQAHKISINQSNNLADQQQQAGVAFEGQPHFPGCNGGQSFTWDNNVDPNNDERAIYPLDLKAFINNLSFATEGENPSAKGQLTMIKGLITTY